MLKSIDELESMAEEDILDYINRLKPSRQQVEFWLFEQEIPYKTNFSHKKLKELFAREVAVRGMYKRIARNNK
jgi:hypothetical protein